MAPVISRIKSKLIPLRVSQAWGDVAAWLAGADAEYGEGTKERLLRSLAEHPSDSLEHAVEAAIGTRPRLNEEPLPRINRTHLHSSEEALHDDIPPSRPE